MRATRVRLVDLVIVQHEIGRPDLARETARQLSIWRPDFTVEAWTRTQLGSDPARLDADVAALLVAGLRAGTAR